MAKTLENIFKDINTTADLTPTEKSTLLAITSGVTTLRTEQNNSNRPDSLSDKAQKLVSIADVQIDDNNQVRFIFDFDCLLAGHEKLTINLNHSTNGSRIEFCDSTTAAVIIPRATITESGLELKVAAQQNAAPFEDIEFVIPLNIPSETTTFFHETLELYEQYTQLKNIRAFLPILAELAKPSNLRLLSELAQSNGNDDFLNLIISTIREKVSKYASNPRGSLPPDIKKAASFSNLIGQLLDTENFHHLTPNLVLIMVQTARLNAFRDEQIPAELRPISAGTVKSSWKNIKNFVVLHNELKGQQLLLQDLLERGFNLDMFELSKRINEGTTDDELQALYKHLHPTGSLLAEVPTHMYNFENLYRIPVTSVETILKAANIQCSFSLEGAELFVAGDKLHLSLPRTANAIDYVRVTAENGRTISFEQVLSNTWLIPEELHVAHNYSNYSLQRELVSTNQEFLCEDVEVLENTTHYLLRTPNIPTTQHTLNLVLLVSDGQNTHHVRQNHQQCWPLPKELFKDGRVPRISLHRTETAGYSDSVPASTLYYEVNDLSEITLSQPQRPQREKLSLPQEDKTHYSAGELPTFRYDGWESATQTTNRIDTSDQSLPPIKVTEFAETPTTITLRLQLSPVILRNARSVTAHLVEPHGIELAVLAETTETLTVEIPKSKITTENVELVLHTSQLGNETPATAFCLQLPKEALKMLSLTTHTGITNTESIKEMIALSPALRALVNQPEYLGILSQCQEFIEHEGHTQNIRVAFTKYLKHLENQTVVSNEVNHQLLVGQELRSLLSEVSRIPGPTLNRLEDVIGLVEIAKEAFLREQAQTGKTTIPELRTLHPAIATFDFQLTLTKLEPYLAELVNKNAGHATLRQITTGIAGSEYAELRQELSTQRPNLQLLLREFPNLKVVELYRWVQPLNLENALQLPMIISEKGLVPWNLEPSKVSGLSIENSLVRVTPQGEFAKAEVAVENRSISMVQKDGVWICPYASILMLVESNPNCRCVEFKFTTATELKNPQLAETYREGTTVLNTYVAQERLTQNMIVIPWTLTNTPRLEMSQKISETRTLKVELTPTARTANYLLLEIPSEFMGNNAELSVIDGSTTQTIAVDDELNAYYHREKPIFNATKSTVIDLLSHEGGVVEMLLEPEQDTVWQQYLLNTSFAEWERWAQHWLHVNASYNGGDDEMMEQYQFHIDRLSNLLKNYGFYFKVLNLDTFAQVFEYLRQ